MPAWLSTCVLSCIPSRGLEVPLPGLCWGVPCSVPQAAEGNVSQGKSSKRCERLPLLLCPYGCEDKIGFLLYSWVICSRPSLTAHLCTAGSLAQPLLERPEGCRRASPMAARPGGLKRGAHPHGSRGGRCWAWALTQGRAEGSGGAPAGTTAPPQRPLRVCSAAAPTCLKAGPPPLGGREAGR